MQNNNLPIIGKAATAYKMWHGFLESFPRLSRYTLGARIDGLFVETIELLLDAGYSQRQEKLQLVDQAGRKLDALKFFLQVAWELKALDNKQCLALSNPVTEVGKMLGGWRKQLANKAPVR